MAEISSCRLCASEIKHLDMLYGTISNLSKTKYSRIFQPSWNERDFHSHSIAIVDVVGSKEFDQGSLLHSDPEIEKPPQENGKEDKGNPVLEGELCA